MTRIPLDAESAFNLKLSIWMFQMLRLANFVQQTAMLLWITRWHLPGGSLPDDSGGEQRRSKFELRMSV